MSRSTVPDDTAESTAGALPSPSQAATATQPGLDHLPRDVLRGLEPLLRGFQYSRIAGDDVWQWAVPAEELFLNGLVTPDLQWLIHEDLARHGREITVAGDERRTFRNHSLPLIHSESSIVLTERGASLVRTALENCRGAREPLPTACPPAARDEVPVPDATSVELGAGAIHWDVVHRELRCDGQLVKHFCVPAGNQERILCAFQEQDWPARVDDPLPRNLNLEPHRRLQATIKSLNRNQVNALVCFYGNGTGTMVCWEYLGRL